MTTTTSNMIKVSPKAMRKHALNCIASDTPFFLWGNPGIGKSEILKALVEKLGYHFEDIRLSQIESVDLRGLPTKQEDENGKATVAWAMPDFLRRAREAKAAGKRGTAFFFDELNSGSPATMAAAYQFINDRRIGCFELQEGDIVFAAGNLESDGGVTNSMPLPLANRFRHYWMEVSTPQWLDYASEAGLHPYVISYLSIGANTGKLQDFNVDKLLASDEKAFATPRSWKMLSKGLYAAYGGEVKKGKSSQGLDGEAEVFNVYDEEDPINENDISVIAASCVGSGIAVEFSGFVKEGMDLPKARDILEGKKLNIDIKNKSSAQYFIANDCSHALKEMKLKVESIKQDVGDKSEQFKDALKAYVKSMENYILFAKEHFARELFVYGVITVMLKRYKVVPLPQYMDKKVFDLLAGEFNKAKLSD